MANIILNESGYTNGIQQRSERQTVARSKRVTNGKERHGENIAEKAKEKAVEKHFVLRSRRGLDTPSDRSDLVACRGLLRGQCISATRLNIQERSSSAFQGNTIIRQAMIWTILSRVKVIKEKGYYRHNTDGSAGLSGTEAQIPRIAASRRREGAGKSGLKPTRQRRQRVSNGR